MVLKKRGQLGIVLSLVIVLFMLSLVNAESEGCYIFPQASEDVYCAPGISQTEAEADCTAQTGCKLDQYFFPGNDCSQFDECKQIYCSVDCEYKSWGKCQQLAGNGKEAQALNEEEMDYWCNPGCCKYTKPGGIEDCKFLSNRYTCYNKAYLVGVKDTAAVMFDNALGMNQQSCSVKYCGTTLASSNMSIIVKNTLGEVLSGAQVKIDTKVLSSDALGKAFFINLNPATYLVSASLSGYLDKTATVTLAPGASSEIIVILTSAEGAASVSGTVKDQSNVLLDQAQVAWINPATGAILGKTFTNAEGKFTLSALPQGEFTFTASKLGYTAQSKSLTITGKSALSLAFQLNKSIATVVAGKTYLDLDSDKTKDPEESTYGVKVYVDGVFKGYSKFSTDPNHKGEFEISLILSKPTEKHNLSASYGSYEAETVEFEISTGKTVVKDLLLKAYVGECSQNGANPQKNIETFTASAIPGQKKVVLEWKMPCPEVIGYAIEKTEDGQDDGNSEKISASPSAKNYVDEKVEWGKTYTYKIKAIYDSKLESAEAQEQTITMGDEVCEGKYHPNIGWETFCYGEDKQTRKVIWTCNADNKVIPAKNCAEQDGGGEDYYCSRVSEYVAECKNAGDCRLFADPFGLYYNRDSCYGFSSVFSGEKATNFCYYDSTNTIVDKCSSCTEIKSCFDYRSKDACEVNSCVGTDCTWVNGAANSAPIVDYEMLFSKPIPTKVTEETGAGYCTPQKYTKDDKCEMCSSASTLFKNYFCTAQVCSALGNCFSADQLQRCQACGDHPDLDANCYAYTTESECVGDTTIYQYGLLKDALSKITPSHDRCGWEKCYWQGTPGGTGSCVKDGNGNRVDDCLGFVNAGETSSCKIDNSAPRTKVIPEGINVLSFAYPNITFEGNDEFHKFANQRNKLGKVGICLTSADPSATDSCVIDAQGNSPFVEFAYPGKTSIETIAVNAIGLVTSKVNGETYRIKYYSTDKYLNQESIQEAFVYVDNVIPEFEIVVEDETIADVSSLHVSLMGIEEPLECKFALKPVIPVGTEQISTLGFEIKDKEVSFENLDGARYDLNVSCTDEQGNVNSKTQTFVFDFNQKIDILFPEPNGVVADTSIEFKVHTDVSSYCGLYLTATQEKVADFISDESGKEHYTEAIGGFIERAYLGEYEVMCTELLGDASLGEGSLQEVDYFYFTIDFTAPQTQIVLTEESRKEQPTGIWWEENFINSVSVGFECSAQGFACDKTYYCLGSGCELVGNPNYKEYTEEFALEETTDICYYSTDKGGNVPEVSCGKINVDGFGITLEYPDLYFYNNEVWGVSNVPEFDYGFFTKVPTAECGIDFTSGFDYTTLPEHKLKMSNQNHYLFLEFPTSVFASEYSSSGGVKKVYVLCKNVDEVFGPEKKMNIEYDPTVPEITSAEADPNQVYEEIFTTLKVSTDDKTLCKFSDNSEELGSSEYSSMEYSFPGVNNNTLNINHAAEFSIGQVGDNGKKDYSLLTQCANGAGDLSNVATINFSVDYTAIGFIIPSSLSPQGYLSAKDTILSLATSKNAQCEFRENSSEEYITMNGAGGKQHDYALSGLEEKSYSYPVKCVLGDHEDEDKIEFTVDVTAPVITEVDDGEYTCGNDAIKLLVYTPESQLKEYYYEVYDMGASAAIANELGLELDSSEIEPKTDSSAKSSAKKANQNSSSTNSSSPGSSSSPSSSSTSKGTFIINGTVAAEANESFEIPLPNVNDSHKYIVKVAATDAAGNIGQFKESDGVYAVDKKYKACAEDKSAPTVNVVMNDSCSLLSSQVELKCVDAIGCAEFKYGLSASSTSCVPNLEYNGEKLSVDKTKWLCYFVSDSKGNNQTKAVEIKIVDKDGDGVSDTCDKCTSTGLGKVVDASGCSSSEPKADQKAKDTDGDGLPDSWEKQYAADNCLFDPTSKDSDGDGVPDSLNDYDNDGYYNHQEFTSGTNPCVADQPKAAEEEPKPTAPVLPDLGGGDGGNIVAIVLLILGILMFGGGIGYLVYYYRFAPKPSVQIQRGPVVQAPVQPRPQSAASWKDRFSQFRRTHEDRFRQMRRENIMGGFTAEAKDKTFGSGSSSGSSGSSSLNQSRPQPQSRSSSGSAIEQLRRVSQSSAQSKSAESNSDSDTFSKLKGIAAGKKQSSSGKSKSEDVFAKLNKIGSKPSSSSSKTSPKKKSKK